MIDLRKTVPVGLLLVVSAGGCGSDALKLPLPAMPVSSLGHEAAASLASSDQPVDVYSRLAGGVLRCWFGADGSLKKTHTFHARVPPPSSGGTSAEMFVYSRDPANPGHGALAALRIGIAATPTGSSVEVQNVRFPPSQGAEMIADVRRWLSGKEECSVIGVGGWASTPPGPVQPKSVKTGRAKPGKAGAN
jgi:hypothetical protein